MALSIQNTVPGDGTTRTVVLLAEARTPTQRRLIGGRARRHRPGAKLVERDLAAAPGWAMIYPGARHEVVNEINRDEVLALITFVSE